MVCKLCGEDRKLIDAHIIPKRFWKPLFDPKNPPLLVTNTPDIYPKKSPIGVYDKTIMCGNCEKNFMFRDDYAQKILLSNDGDRKYISLNGKRVSFVIDGVDYVKLKLFFVSLLWRASVSTQRFFSKVKIGQCENKLREMIKNNDPGDPDLFSVNLANFDDPLGNMKLDPHKTTFSSVTFFVFYLRGYIAYIKVDNRPTPEWMADFMLKLEDRLFVIVRDFRGSKELQVMKKVARESQEFVKKNKTSK